MVPPVLHYDRLPVDDFEALLGHFKPGELASPTRSTVPLLALLKDSRSTLEGILSACGAEDCESFSFEFAVESPKGPGKAGYQRASYTDLMVVSGGLALAVEAKWTEPPYPTVKERLEPFDGIRMRPSAEVQLWRDSQMQILEGWLDLLRPHATRPLHLSSFDDAIYQMVHRAASACSMGRPPALAYLHFEAAEPPSGMTAERYHADLTRLSRLLDNPVGFPFYLISVGLSFCPGFAAIKGLKKREASTDQAIRSALLSSRLFEFDEPVVRLIQPSAQ